MPASRPSPRSPRRLFPVPTWAPVILAAFLCLALFPTPAPAFGNNKLRTREFRWQIFETRHFEIFYYPEEEALAREVCREAEAAFEHNTRLLRFRPVDKIPLFLYGDQVDFQQTNITPSVIGVGTGGFTEAYKNRIALPAPASPRLLRQVIQHELMHALQFDILYGEGIRSFRVYKGYLMPLWLIEGLAEYAAQDWDTLGEMVVRDAVLNDQLPPLTLMDGFGHLENVYLAYKESQLACQFLADRYGEEKLALVMKKFKNQISLSQILRETLGLGLSEFNAEFQFWLRQRYWVQAAGRSNPDQLATPLRATPPGRPILSAGPAWSPDGRYLAYLSDADQTERIYLRERGADEARALTATKFEAVSWRGRPLAWSPDGRRLAFVARQEGKTGLYLADAETGRCERQDLPLDDYASPAWSPDGRRLALSGTLHGVGDIYLWDLAAQTLAPLTADRWADDAPAWSPDGRTIVFSSERGADWQLVSRAADDPGAPERLLTPGAGDRLQPGYAPDGRLLYAADAGGIFNLFRLDPATGATEQLTDVRVGLFQPAVSPDGKRLAFCAYERGGREIYTAAYDHFAALTPLAPPAAGYARALPAALPQGTTLTAEPGEEALLAESEASDPEEEAAPAADPILASRPYGFRFSPDLLFLLAGYDSSQGVVGGGYLSASDYLGDHLVGLQSNFVPGYQAQTSLTYGNYASPVDVLATVAYSRNYYRLIDLETGTLTDEFNDQQTLGGLALSKPFSLFDRLEAEFALRILRREHGEEVLNRRITTLRLGLVHDSTEGFDFEPANGFRHQLSVLWADRILGGEENYSLVQLNTQMYKSLDFLNPRLVFGGRLIAAASLGPEHPVLLFAGIGVLPGSGTIRGFRYGDLLGSQVAAANLELRFPLARNVNYSLWPLDFLLLKDIQMVFFDDLGAVTNNFLELNAREIRNSVGVGWRVHTFLLGKELLTLRFDIAKLTDGTADPYYAFGLGQAF